MTSLDKLNKINRSLTQMIDYIKTANKSNLTDASVVSENIFRDILNIIWKVKLENTNINVSNEPIIDLYDQEVSLGVQITSNETQIKVRNTLKKFIESQNPKSLKNIKIVILGQKKKYDQKKINELTNNQQIINVVDDIIDKNGIFKLIQNLPYKEQEEILKILDREMPDKTPFVNSHSYKISISFDSSYIDSTLKICQKLIEEGFYIYTNSETLVKQIKHPFNTSIEFKTSKQIPDDVEHCIILLTQRYYDNFLRNRTVCPFVEEMYSRNNRFLTFKLNEKIPYINKFNIEKSAVYRVPDGNIEKIVFTATKRIKNSIPKFEKYDVSKILKKYNNNIDLLKTFTESKSKIGYDIYIKKDDFDKSNIKEYFICLHKGITSINTKNHILSEHESIKSYIKKENVLILLPREKGQKDDSIRRDNIAKEFGIRENRVINTDDFCWRLFENEYSNIEREKFLNNANYYVEPYLIEYKQNEKEKLESQIITKSWLENEDSAILLLFSSAGMGKTTLARKIADEFYDKHSESGLVIFLDSAKMIHNLQKEGYKRDEPYDLYSFYEASIVADGFDLSNSSKIQKDVFNYNFDNGNLLIVIDGIDEVISKVGEFVLEDFINSILENTKSIGLGKVVITSRQIPWIDEYINKYEKTEIEIYEISPFDEELTTLFLEKKGINQKKRSKIIENLKNLYKGKVFEISPFIIDAISDTSYDNGNDKLDGYFDTDYLIPENSTQDFIVAALCNREITREGQEPIDIQLDVLIDICINFDCIISIDKLRDDILPRYNIAKSKIVSFEKHPLLVKKDQTLDIKYDFLEELFKSIFIANCIKKPTSHIGKTFSKHISEYTYQSQLTNDLKERISEVEVERLKYIFFELDYNYRELKDETYSEAISGLFIICLSIFATDYSTLSNTKTLIELFGNEDNGVTIIQSFHIRKVNSLSKMHFDFSDLIFKDCLFNGYENFFENKFTNQTFFYDTCTIKNVKSITNNSAVQKSNFGNVNKDDSYDKFFEFRNFKNNNKNALILDLLKQFFNAFEENGIYKDRNINSLKVKLNRYLLGVDIEFEDFIFILINLKLINKIQKESEMIAIINECKIDIQKLCKDGRPTPVILNVMKTLISEIY